MKGKVHGIFSYQLDIDFTTVIKVSEALIELVIVIEDIPVIEVMIDV